MRRLFRRASAGSLRRDANEFGMYGGLRTALLCAGLISAACSLMLAQTPDPRALFQQALEAQQNGDFAAAVSKYKELIRLQPGLTSAHANLAGALVSLGRFDEAIAEYRTALEQVPGNRALELNLAMAYFKKGDTASARALFAPLHDASPSDERVAILLADCDLRLNRDAEAVSILSPFDASDSQNLDVEWALGSALIAVGRGAEGVERVQKVAEKGDSAEAYALAAQTYLKLDRFNLARQDVEAALRLNPNLAGLDTIHGMVLDYFGDPNGAEAAFARALKRNPNDFQAQLRLGSVLYSQRSLAAAAAHLDRAVELDPSSAPAHYERGRVERAQGQLEAALKDLEAAERDDSAWLAPHIELTALYYRLKRPADGAREKQIVDRLSAEEQQRGAKRHIISPEIPSQ